MSTTTLPKWSNAEEWFAVLDQIKAEAGADAVSLCIMLPDHSVTFSAGSEPVGSDD